MNALRNVVPIDSASGYAVEIWLPYSQQWLRLAPKFASFDSAAQFLGEAADKLAHGKILRILDASQREVYRYDGTRV